MDIHSASRIRTDPVAHEPAELGSFDQRKPRLTFRHDATGCPVPKCPAEPGARIAGVANRRTLRSQLLRAGSALIRLLLR